jgi:ketosteroid isomerase-like protein
VDGAAVLGRLEQALNSHDLEQLVECFDEEVLSEQPVHPSRTFRGRDQVEKNWTQIFAAFPDLEARLVRSTVDGDTVWAEWDWHAVRSDGTAADIRGLTVLGIASDRIGWVRFYMEPVEQDGAGIDAAVRDHASAT